MPEGPTIHRLAKEHRTLLSGQKLRVSSPQGRFEPGAKSIDGKTLTSIDACGKHLFYHFAGRRILHVHLGLYGKFRVHPTPPPEPRGAVRVRMIGRLHTIDLNGPNACAVIDPPEAQSILDRLGPDPLRADADPARAFERIAASRTPIGMLLMDQSVIAGIGNIYRSELLWLLKIHPKAVGQTLRAAKFKRLWSLTQSLMEFAVEHGRIVTAPTTKLKKPVARLTAAERFNIYKRPHCPRCHAKIVRFLMGGRQVFACESCQIPPAD